MEAIVTDQNPEQGTPPDGWVEGEQMPGKLTWHEESDGKFPDDLNPDDYNIVVADNLDDD